jgi:hypothetical protein
MGLYRLPQNGRCACRWPERVSVADDTLADMREKGRA